METVEKKPVLDITDEHKTKFSFTADNKRISIKFVSGAMLVWIMVDKLLVFFHIMGVINNI